MRVYELAKDLGVTSKDLVAQLQNLGVGVKNHMSTVGQDAIDLLRDGTSSDSGNGSAQAAPAEPAVDAAPPEPDPAKSEPAEPAPDETHDPLGSSAEAPAKPGAAPQSDEAISAEGKVIHARGAIIVKDLARALGLKPNELIAELMRLNILASINERIDLKTATAICEKNGYTLEHQKRVTQRQPVATKKLVELSEDDDRPEDLELRPPIVTCLGHVDHGKTSLLDKIRNTDVAEGEAGGITQHIGASVVDVAGATVTFLDTPGHGAFTAMRARGANLTDVAVIVIAADDGVMPQTQEAIQHAQAAGVAIMIAINKCDLPTINTDRVKQQLQQMDLSPEDWGGETICCEVSAMTGDGIDHLLEMIALQAEVLELRANPKRRAQGYVIEARLEKGMGPTANLLVMNGTLKVGDAVYCSPFWGRVKALINDKGVMVKTAGPSDSVKCMGLCGVPEPGAAFQVYANEKAARAKAEKDQEERKVVSRATPARSSSIQDLFQTLEDEERVALKLIIKADVQGTLEAIEESLKNIKSDKVTLDIILTGTSNVTANDVMLAVASNAMIVAFNVSLEDGVNKALKQHSVTVRMHTVIYELIDEVENAMQGLLEPELEEAVKGQAEVKEVFTISRTGKIAGCQVVSGAIARGQRTRVRRNGDVIFTGALGSLRRFQNDVSEVRDGQECGIRLENFSDFAEGDIIEFFEVTEVTPTL